MLSEDAIVSNKFISKHQDTHLFMSDDVAQNDYFLQFENPAGFLKSLDRSTQRNLLRTKVDKHMNAVHPEGVKLSEMFKMFKRYNLRTQVKC